MIGRSSITAPVCPRSSSATWRPIARAGCGSSVTTASSFWIAEQVRYLRGIGDRHRARIARARIEDRLSGIRVVGLAGPRAIDEHAQIARALSGHEERVTAQ